MLEYVNLDAACGRKRNPHRHIRARCESRNPRLAMVRASHESNGERGFPLNVAMYLAQRYGYVAGVDLRSRVAEQLALVRERLRGGSYFGGERVSALDIYVATFLTPLSAIDEAHARR